MPDRSARGRRVRVLRQQHQLVALVRGVRLVHARVRAHEAVVGHADERAVDARGAARRTRRARPGRARGSLRCSAASARARSPGSISSSRRTRPSAFETTLCASTSTSPSAEVGGRGRGDQSREVVAGPDRRQRRERADAERGQAEACGRRAVDARRGRAGEGRRAWRAPGRGAARAPRELGEVVGRVHVEREAGHPLDAAWNARRLGRGHMAREAARPEARLDRVGRREHAARWCRCRADRARSRLPLAAARAGPPAPPARAEACRPARAGRGRSRRRARGGCRSGRPPTGPLWRSSRSTGTRSPGAADSATRSARDHGDAVELRARGAAEASTSLNIAWASACACAGAERVGEALLCSAKALHWEDRDRASSAVPASGRAYRLAWSEAAKSSTSRASRSRASGGVHERVRHERRPARSRRLVGDTTPSITSP